MNFNDNPIEESQQDSIDRTALAEKFAQQVLDLDASNGIVVGVLGPWGSGKTSFVNLARREFNEREIPILEFNPWMFSNTGQLVKSFFAEFVAQLELRNDDDLAKIGAAILNYAPLFLSLLPGGQIVGTFARLAGDTIGRRNRSVEHERSEIEEALSGLDKPIIVLLDDVDRLTTSEIRDVFKLVRLIANFPNVIYIVVFDRDRVERALDERGIKGRDYIEKILQFSADLPVVSRHVLCQQIRSAIVSALNEVDDPGPFDEQVWSGVLQRVVAPLIQNMRDVNRYSVSIHTAIRSLEGRIQLADLFALEAVRMFLPDVFKLLHGSIDDLTSPRDPNNGHGASTPPAHPTVIVKALIKAAGDQKQHVVESMIELLFPAAAHNVGGSAFQGEGTKEWLKERRIAYPDILKLYLERRVSEHLQAFIDSERAWERMHELNDFEENLNTLNPANIHNVIALLELFEDQFTSNHVIPGITVLLNLFSAPECRREKYDLSLSDTVNRITGRLLRSLDDHQKLNEAIHDTLGNLRSLSSKWKLITIVGHREKTGQKLVSEDKALEHEKDWRVEVRRARVDNLLKEYDLFRILLDTKHDAAPSEDPLAIDDSPEMTFALLYTAQRETKNQAIQSSAWKNLIFLYNNEDKLITQVQNLRSADPERFCNYIRLANEYLSPGGRGVP